MSANGTQTIKIEEGPPASIPKSCFDKLKMKVSTLDKICSFLAELIGTALLVFLGCMGCVKNDSYENNHFQMTFNFGLVVMIIIQCFGCVSGAHLNPAVTLAAYIYNMTSLAMAGVYFVAQMLGGFIGYGLLKALIPINAVTLNGPHNLCVTTVHAEISAWQGCAIEFIITGVLIFTCCGVWDPRNSKFHDSVPIRFGLAISCLAITAGQFTGASMNPARSFAPSLWNSDFQDQWIYWVGPLASAAVCSIVYKTIFRREVVEEKVNNKLRAMEEVPLS
ncbi:aquaporin AQPAe.a-like isoform X2 [Rhagoletis pomonella]|uniref:aquaporin AQPAe.a-like isoform X2 n=1 Tax=Rhagoletis pomonella TaxID=28610 RepID=UPI00177C4615|nr:aquaporin AQPAe.a-like isoform X2 [Rhagoletis pomonella]